MRNDQIEIEAFIPCREIRKDKAGAPVDLLGVLYMMKARELPMVLGPGWAVLVALGRVTRPVKVLFSVTHIDLDRPIITRRFVVEQPDDVRIACQTTIPLSSLKLPLYGEYHLNLLVAGRIQARRRFYLVPMSGLSPV